MTSITAAELNLLRSRPHETGLWLSIYDPPVIFSAQIDNASAAPGDRVIIWDSTTGTYSGTPYDIYSGMTMYVGTTAGARDVGKVRVRSATGTPTYTITVAANSDINWADNLYLTVVELIEIGSIYPRMDIPDPADPTQQVWYKDYDIAYTNQNSSLGTFICMGSHYAGFLDGGLCRIYYSASGTYNLKGEVVTYAWDFGKKSPAELLPITVNTPGYIDYDTPGHFTTRLTVQGTSPDSEDKSFRHISIYDRPGEGDNVPILNWELLSLDGSRDMGGYEARIKIRENIDDVIDGALVVIFADDTYGTTKQSIGGNGLNRQKIVFVGYILEGSIAYNYEDSSVECSVGSPTEVMKLAGGFGVALNSSSDPEAQDAVDDDIPSAWALMLNMDCKRSIYHYLRWHSTVLLTNDFEFKGTDKYIEYFDADRESLFDAVNNLMKGTLYGDIVCDRQGKIWSEVSVAATDSASTSFPVAINIIKQDWIGTPAIEETFNQRTAYLEMGGIACTPAASGTFINTSAAYMSCAPGTEPSYRGNVQRIQGLALNSQADLNTLCGNIYAYMNSKYSHVDLELSGNYRNIDIAPQEIINLNLEASDTPRQIVWSNKAFHPTAMSWSYDPGKGTLLPTLTLHEVTQGFDGGTITIPPIPPVTDPGGGGFDIPPIVIPPFTFSGWLYVYHNGVFVAAVNGLNFVDS